MTHTAPVRSIAGHFSTDSILRAVAGQKATIDPLKFMEERTVLLCNFSKAMGETPAHLLERSS